MSEVKVIKVIPADAGISRLSEKRKDELRNLYDTQGLQACLKEASLNVEARTTCEGLNYDFWVGSAEIIGKKMREGITLHEFDYLGEKMRQLFGLAETVTRFEDKKIHERYRKAYDSLKELGF